MPENPLPVWAALSDAALERRLRHYLWKANLGEPDFPGRIGQLTAEAERRGKPEMVERAKTWVRQSKTAPLL